MATAKKASTKGKTTSETRGPEPHVRHEGQRSAAKTQSIEVRPSDAASLPDLPETSQVLRGGGVARGAILHVKIPTPSPTNATDEANTPLATDDQLYAIGRLKEGGEFTFDLTSSLPLSEGGYVSVRKVRVLQQERGRAIVEVVS